MRRKQHIYKVNLRGLLLGGGIQLQQRRDGDGLSKQPLSLLGDAVPEGIRLAIVDVPQLVHLPEDDTTVTRHAQPVALCGTLHLLHGQITHADTCTAEPTSVGEVTLNEASVSMQNQMLAGLLRYPCLDSRTEGAEGMLEQFAEFHCVRIIYIYNIIYCPYIGANNIYSERQFVVAQQVVVLPLFALPVTATSSPCGKHSTPNIWNRNSIGGKRLSGVMRRFISCELPQGYTVDTLLGEHSSRPRNKNIANVFYLAGFIESWGRGFDKVRKGFVAKGLPMPTLESKFGGLLSQ